MKKKNEETKKMKLTRTNEDATKIRMIAEELVGSLLGLTFSFDVPCGDYGSVYVFGRQVDEWADGGNLRVGLAGCECFANPKG